MLVLFVFRRPPPKNKLHNFGVLIGYKQATPTGFLNSPNLLHEPVIASFCINSLSKYLSDDLVNATPRGGAGKGLSRNSVPPATAGEGAVSWFDRTLSPTAPHRKKCKGNRKKWGVATIVSLESKGRCSGIWPEPCPPT